MPTTTSPSLSTSANWSPGSRRFLRRTQAARDLSPLTGPSGQLPDRPGDREPESEPASPFALVHCDLDNFKAFNDHYGFMRGDEVIRFCARCLGAATDEIGEMDAFVGHIGGDDFVALISAERAEEYCKRVIDRFDDGILDYYDTADALRGLHRGDRSPRARGTPSRWCRSLWAS